MTEQEKAIKYFKMRLAEKTHPPTTAQQKAFATAIEALEKQIPKKPNDYYEDSLDDECAICGTIVFERDRYCPRCGQAIDWSE